MVDRPLLDDDRAGHSELLQRADTSAVAAAFVNTLKSVLGTGLLAMPWAFHVLRHHVGFAVTLCLVLGAWSCYTMLLLYRCMVLAWPVTGGYGELVHAALGPRGGTLCSLNLVVHQVMCVAAYLVFICLLYTSPSPRDS